jgi:hypothetical protein
LGRIKPTGNRIPGGIADAAGPARHVNENRSVDATTLTLSKQTMIDIARAYDQLAALAADRLDSTDNDSG